MLNIELLIKLLGMTGSSFDGEAIAAMRKANQILKEANMSWADIIKPPATARQMHQSTYVKPEYEHFAEPKPWEGARGQQSSANAGDRKAIEFMFEKIFKDKSFENSKPEYREMMHSIHRQWASSGRLSPKQRTVIENAFARAKAL